MRFFDRHPDQHDQVLPWLSWRYSAVFVVAIIALIGTLVYAAEREHPVEIAVMAPNGDSLANARVTVDGLTYLTDDAGTVRLPRPDAAQEITVEYDGYVGMAGSIDPNTRADQTVTLQLASVGGATAPSGSASSSAAITDQLTESLGSAPAATPPPSMPASSPVATAASTAQAAGMVTDDAGKPIARAWVTAGETYVFTGADGVFLFDPGTVAQGQEMRVFAPGYREEIVQARDVATPLAVQLELRPIKGIYLNPNLTNTEEGVDRLIEMINTTELNAVVIDVKEEMVFYDTQVQFFRDAGTVMPVMDLPALLKKMQDNGIYTIARLVVFKDSLVAENNPDLAVLDNVTGGLWRDQNGVAWVNPMVHTLWDVNLELAYEAATLGFDEIQYDYVRFPTDGDMSRVDYGLENTREIRERSISKFLEMSHERLIPTGVKLSADVFGYTVIVDDDLGIGQNFTMLADKVDYLSPMVYPSHWPEGSIDVPGHPNDFPYETIDISMKAAKAKLGGSALQVRPWLQDFDYYGLAPYDAGDVRAQIDAAEDNGTSGWLLWDPNNTYHPKALKPEEDTATPAPSPQAVIERNRPGASVRVRRA